MPPFFKYSTFSLALEHFSFYCKLIINRLNDQPNLYFKTRVWMFFGKVISSDSPLLKGHLLALVFFSSFLLPFRICNWSKINESGNSTICSFSIDNHTNPYAPCRKYRVCDHRVRRFFWLLSHTSPGQTCAILQSGSSVWGFTSRLFNVKWAFWGGRILADTPKHLRVYLVVLITRLQPKSKG